MLVNVTILGGRTHSRSIPTELWLAMGISATSPLGSRLIIGAQASDLEPRDPEPMVRESRDPVQTSRRETERPVLRRF